MPAEQIEVAPEDEVPAIVERIRRSRAEEIHLILPPHARFGQSRFNFQLLRQYSTRLGKRVAIWSPDSTVQRLAEESGFGGLRVDPPAPHPPAGSPDRSRARAAGGRPGGPDGGPGQPASAFRPAAAQPPYAQPPPYATAPPTPRGASPGGRPGAAGRAAGSQGTPAAGIRIGTVGRRLPAQLTQYEPARYALYGGAVLVLLAGIFAVIFYVPTARVTLVAQAQPFSTQVDVATQPGKGPVRVRSVNVSKSASVQGQATGVKSTPGQLASGQFTYVNNCQFALQIASGQRLRSTTGAVFAQLADVTVDHNQQRTVDIKAVQSGQASNVGPGQITGIDANQFACMSGTNQGPMSGGTDDQKQTVIQGSDIQGAKAALETQVRQQILDELDRGVQRGEKRVRQPQFGVEQFNTTHNVDEPFPNFTATLKLDAEGDYYVADDVDRAFTDTLRSKVPSDKQLTNNKVLTAYTETAGQGGRLDFVGTANGYIAPRIEVDKIKNQLAGKPSAQANDMLSRLPVKRSVINQSPPLPLMPLSAGRIYIDYGVEAQSPQPT